MRIGSAAAPPRLSLSGSKILYYNNIPAEATKQSFLNTIMLQHELNKCVPRSIEEKYRLFCLFCNFVLYAINIAIIILTLAYLLSLLASQDA